MMMTRPPSGHDGGPEGPDDASVDMDARVEAADAAVHEAGPPPSDAAPGLADAASDASLADAGPSDAGVITFRYVYEHIIGVRCAYCHHPDSDGDGGNDWAMIGWSLGHLDMHTADDAYANLVGSGDGGVQAAGIHCGPEASGLDYRRVIPGDPVHSLILHKISEDIPVCGVRMPDDSSGALDAGEIQLIHDWIEEGARW